MAVAGVDYFLNANGSPVARRWPVDDRQRRQGHHLRLPAGLFRGRDRVKAFTEAVKGKL